MLRGKTENSQTIRAGCEWRAADTEWELDNGQDSSNDPLWGLFQLSRGSFLGFFVSALSVLKEVISQDTWWVSVL